MIQETEESETQRRNSEVVISRIDKDENIESTRQWLASYLSNGMEDDFRRRYFSRIRVGVGAVNKNRKNSSSSPEEKNKDLLNSKVNGTVRKPVLGNLAKTEEEMMDVEYIDLRQLWVQVMNKSNDEVRFNFLKTLKSRNLLSEKPSIKEQTSIFSKS